MAYSREKVDMDALVKRVADMIESAMTKVQHFYPWEFILL